MGDDAGGEGLLGTSVSGLGGEGGGEPRADDCKRPEGYGVRGRWSLTSSSPG